MGAVTVAVLVPGEVPVVAGDADALQIGVGDEEAGVDDAYLASRTGRRAIVHDAVAVGIPDIARLDHVDAVGDGLGGGLVPARAQAARVVGGGFGNAYERPTVIFLDEEDVRILPQVLQLVGGDGDCDGAELVEFVVECFVIGAGGAEGAPPVAETEGGGDLVLHLLLVPGLVPDEDAARPAVAAAILEEIGDRGHVRGLAGRGREEVKGGGKKFHDLQSLGRLSQWLCKDRCR